MWPGIPGLVVEPLAMVSSEGACAAYWKYGRRPAASLVPLGLP